MAAVASGTGSRTGGGPRRGLLGRWGLGQLLQGLGITVGLIAMVGGFAVLAVQYRPYSVPTDSMQPTIKPGDVVLAHPVTPSAIGRGDVVVFNDPQWEGSNLVKRVVGIGGDTVVCCDSSGRITVDGHPVTEPYTRQAGALAGVPQTKFTAVVPPGRLFLLGDNRAVSQDSRVHLMLDDGTVAADQVLARVDGTVWPLGHTAAIARTTAFDALPGRDASAHGPLAAATWATLGGAALVLLTAALGTLGGLARRLRGHRE
ncbi:signal peptidase I [Streptacidiphilus sp. PB12-B1b]|uniref:signal peptidase I n=1 Tax=Streptacidiphilus sp. PB12-B1b TaxID=2705012 RepID=UPI0015F7B7E1|nr:signal peptidase I [Streptacidiphilus sp. PB12-B1b]QMU78909.1 signal peptidase I [Streptacidiphilus sp. PB12-B1b]